MGETLWCARRAGEFDGPGPHSALVRDSPRAALEPGHDPSAMLLFGDVSVPHRCIVPDDSPVDAGRELRILRQFRSTCRHPNCAEEPHEIRLFLAERGWVIGECPRTGFSWMRMD